MSEESEINNHTSKIDVFLVLHTIFFIGRLKIEFFRHTSVRNSTLCN